MTAVTGVSRDRILSVDIDAPEETPQMAFLACAQLTQEIVRQGRADVDAVSGATVTSEAIKAAVAETLRQAGGEDGADAATDMRPGCYAAAAKGYKSEIKLETEVNTREILTVRIKAAAETPGLGQDVPEKMAARIVETQSLAVDGISGATVTCSAVRQAVQKTVAMAGGSPGAFLRPPVKPETLLTEKTEQTDVVVLGAGIAGFCAAIEALQNGAEVILLEKLGLIGGTAIVARGAMMGTMSRWNSDRGDEAEELANWWYERQEKHENVKYEQLLYVARNSGALINWIADCGGVDFSLGYGGDSPKMWSHRPGDTPEKPAFAEHISGSAELFAGLKACFLRLGGKLRLDTRAVRLLRDGGGVTGIAAESRESEYRIQARGGVVVAAGGYEANPELTARLAPKSAHYLLNGYTAGDTGDGILMGEEIGAKLVGPGYLMGNWNCIEGIGEYGLDPMTLKHEIKCLEVNGRMERFYNENTSAEREKWEFAKDGTGEFFVIFDSSLEAPLLEKFERAAAGGALFRSETIDGLAEAVGKDPAALRKTVARWDEMAIYGKDADFGNALIAAMEPGPYYIGRIYEKSCGSVGGMAINLAAEVLDTRDNPIPGLYAAGESANGEFYYRSYICGGSSFSMGGVFGRTAGRNAARRARNRDGGHYDGG